MWMAHPVALISREHCMAFGGIAVTAFETNDWSNLLLDAVGDASATGKYPAADLRFRWGLSPEIGAGSAGGPEASALSVAQAGSGFEAVSGCSSTIDCTQSRDGTV
jgi:hypothetical protein